MKAVSRKAKQPGPSAAYHWHLLLAVAVVLGGCAGQSGLHATSKGSAPDGAAAAGGWAGGGNGDVGGVMAGGGSVQGGSGMPSGGAGGTTFRLVTSTGGAGGSRTGSTGAATGGVTSQGGSAGGGDGQDGGATDRGIPASADALCDEYSFWEAVTEAMPVIGLCSPAPAGSPVWGDIVLDSEGRVIDVTRLGASRQESIDSLASERWPCLAGQTIRYFCQVGG